MAGARPEGRDDKGAASAGRGPRVGMTAQRGGARPEGRDDKGAASAGRSPRVGMTTRRGGARPEGRDDSAAWRGRGRSVGDVVDCL